VGVTAIKGLENNWNRCVCLYEPRPGPFAGTTAIWTPPGETLDCDTWIPWCTSRNDFRDAKYLVLGKDITPAQLLGPWTPHRWPDRLCDGELLPNGAFYIWQQKFGGDDRVRYAAGRPVFRHGATPVPGASHVNGDRIVVVLPDGSWELRVL
jgi:hypothetical protein